MSHSRVISILLLTLTAHCVTAQQSVFVGIGGSEMMANNFNMPEYDKSAFECEVGWLYHTEGSQEWQRLRRYPSFGVKASFAFIPEGIAGHRFGIAGYLKAPLWKSIDYRLGLGISYYTKPYCLTHDPENIFISSIISCLIDVGLGFNVTDNISIATSLVHTSNGMLYRPNKGFNFLKVGAVYELNVGHPAQERGNLVEAIGTDNNATKRGTNEVGFALSNGVVMSRHLLQDGYFPCYDLSLNYLHYTSPVVAVGGTVDLWYNFSHSWQLPRYNDKYPLPMYLNVQGTCEGFWGPLSIKVGVGGILLASTRVGIRIYERVGAYYNYGNSYVGLGLHARAGMVEFIEVSYGYRIPLKGK